MENPTKFSNFPSISFFIFPWLCHTQTNNEQSGKFIWQSKTIQHIKKENGLFWWNKKKKFTLLPKEIFMEKKGCWVGRVG
jgi:hypothetical protein